MLDYLVTSKVRRHLLHLLWEEQRNGSAQGLAELAGVSFASTHGELKAMVAARLAVSRHVDGKEVFSANLDHPEASTLRALVRSSRARVPESTKDEALKRRLVAMGAPLRGVEPTPVKPADEMSTLVEGARLARRDPTVARCLPLCFWKHRDALDVKALVDLAPGPEDKHLLGFFLELTSVLGRDRRLLGLAETFRDRRLTLERPFAHTDRPGPSRAFPLAKKWGFAMNADLDSFRSLFEKFDRT